MSHPGPKKATSSAAPTVYEIVKAQEERDPDAVAFLAPGRTGLTYHRLLERMEYVVGVLNSAGIGRKDRVSLVLPNGPDMAVAFLATAAGATSVPLSPDHRSEEVSLYLENLDVRGMIVESGKGSNARAAAHARGIPIIELLPERGVGAAAGVFSLDAKKVASDPSPRCGFAEADDIALILHTSGTTSRPKIVPLSHANIGSAAHNVATTLRLTERDRSLNVMPLFHAHGLIASVFASLSTGGSVVCTPGFSPSEFFEWMEEFSPTWFSAVPTIHHSVLKQAERNRQIIDRCPVRFVRSATSALPPEVMLELESVFQAPVIESYGMTEAATQITSNLLPPGQRRPGSAGTAAGMEVAIRSTDGGRSPPGETGEVVIRGPSLMRAYESDPEANRKAFVGGWLRTGDEGYLDSDGYLFITGRLKEMINRGGEKLAPREVEEALLRHPKIAQAVAFAAPHPSLGEDVAAAVVPQGGAVLSVESIREFLFGKLADFKIPSRIFIVDQIPEGPTGKVQRVGLFEELSAIHQPAFVPPDDPVEEVLAAIWAEILSAEPVGAFDNFLALGGDSIGAMRMISRVRDLFETTLTLEDIFRTPTVRGLSERIKTSIGAQEAVRVAGFFKRKNDRAGKEAEEEGGA
jgi:acyl-CoA synthetase (AMP-forming)/AMP-acid ligase II/acyl carrier protein